VQNASIRIVKARIKLFSIYEIGARSATRKSFMRAAKLLLDFTSRLRSLGYVVKTVHNPEVSPCTFYFVEFRGKDHELWWSCFDTEYLVMPKNDKYDIVLRRVYTLNYNEYKLREVAEATADPDLVKIARELEELKYMAEPEASRQYERPAEIRQVELTLVKRYRLYDVQTEYTCELDDIPIHILDVLVSEEVLDVCKIDYELDLKKNVLTEIHHICISDDGEDRLEQFHNLIRLLAQRTS